MKKLLWPDFYAQSIYEINYDALKALGIKGLAFDIDNTLCVYTEKPNQKVCDLFSDLRQKGFTPFIVSNGHNLSRISEICSFLRCKYRAKSLKPFCFGYKELLKELGINKQECVFIGDQIFTDVVAGNLHQGLSIYVEPISREIDEMITVWKRPLEKKILEKYKKFQKKLAK